MKVEIFSRFNGGNFRSPSGAVPTNSSIQFEIQIPRYYGLQETYIVWINDDNNQYEYIKMNWKGIQEGRDVFEKSIDVKNKGLVWYYFQLKSLDQVTYVGKDQLGSVETKTEPPSWQLTIYDESFTTPD